MKNGNRDIRMPRTREFLSSRERTLLTSSEEFYRLTPQERASLFRDLRLKAIVMKGDIIMGGMIEALAFLAVHLPEKQRAKVFTPEVVNGLVESFLGLTLEMRTDRHYQLAQTVAVKSLSILKQKLNEEKFGPILSKDLERIQDIVRLIVQPEKKSGPKK